MDSGQRLQWLRRVLLVKAIVTFLAWGLPALLGPAAFLAWFDVEMPDDPIYLRLVGALALALGLAYWYAYRDPVRNVAIVRVGVVDNALATLVVVVLGLTAGVSSWFVWVSAVLTGLFCVAFLVLMPREAEQGQAT